MTALHAAGWPPPGPGDQAGTHLCPVRGCDWQVEFGRLMCPGHWRQVPKSIQAAVYQTWAGGDGAGTAAHRAAVRAAIGAVNRRMPR